MPKNKGKRICRGLMHSMAQEIYITLLHAWSQDWILSCIAIELWTTSVMLSGTCQVKTIADHRKTSKLSKLSKLHLSNPFNQS